MKILMSNGAQIDVPVEAAKYPMDCVVYQTSTKTFSMVPKLAKRDVSEDSPLKIHSDSFSRFNFTIITKGEGSVRANIEPSEVAGVADATNACYMMQIQHDITAMSGEGSAQNSAAFTKRFVTGKLKGKSPVDVLLENENGKQLLNEQYKFLVENLQKFPKNVELINAIKEAATVDIEKLKEQANAQPQLKPYCVLDIGERPLQRNKRADGKSFCYGCRVMWDFTRKYPVTVTITNYYAPVVVKENGTLNVSYAEKDDVKVYEFNMTAHQWSNTVEQMVAKKRQFEDMYFRSAYELATKISQALAEAAKNNPQG